MVGDGVEGGKGETEPFLTLLALPPNRPDHIRQVMHLMHKLYWGDRLHEDQRKESLGYNFVTQNLQPSALRRPLDLGSCYIKVMVPVLTETFEAKFNGTKCPTYVKIAEDWLAKPSVIGIITGDWAGYIPPVTICE